METTFQTSTSRDRLAFWATFAVGMAACTFGIAQAPVRGWTHPISLLGCAFGAAALGLGGAVLFKKRLGPVSSERRALAALLSIIAVKALLALLYPLVP